MAYWFETRSDAPIAEPLDLTRRPDLQEGDLFFHVCPVKTQMWIWTRNARGALHWLPVHDGYERADGRRLSTTAKNNLPTWREPKYFKKLKRQMQSEFYHCAHEPNTQRARRAGLTGPRGEDSDCGALVAY